MKYLTSYQEYLRIGGILEPAAFNRNIDRACGIINGATHGRIERMSAPPAQAAALCRDLVEYLAEYGETRKSVTSRSQSAGNVSESKSFEQKNEEARNADIDRLLCDYLLPLTDDDGVPLLYRGCGF